MSVPSRSVLGAAALGVVIAVLAYPTAAGGSPAASMLQATHPNVTYQEGRSVMCGDVLHSDYSEPGMYCMVGKHVDGCDGEVINTGYVPIRGRHVKLGHGCAGGVPFEVGTELRQVSAGERIDAPGGFTCVFGAASMRCTSRSGHGFKLTKQGRHKF